MPSVGNAKQNSLSTTAFFFHALTAVVVDSDGHMFYLKVVLIGSMT